MYMYKENSHNNSGVALVLSREDNPAEQAAP